MISDMTSALSARGCPTVSDIHAVVHHAFRAAFVRPGIPQIKTANSRSTEAQELLEHNSDSCLQASV
jgi:hypothetical protein